MNEARDGRRVEATPSESHTVIADKYAVLEELGDGAVGTAYKVRHALLDTLLCVTVLPAALTDDSRQLALVQDAVRQAFGLRHEHIVPVLDFGEEAKRYYLVEAFVDAEPLDRVLRDGKPLAPTDALHVARQLADALAYAHERGVVHGGLTPATVRIHREAPPRALLSGFATAAAAARVPYSAPEQLAGTRVDPRSDAPRRSRSARSPSWCGGVRSWWSTRRSSSRRRTRARSRRPRAAPRRARSGPGESEWQSRLSRHRPRRPSPAGSS